MLYGVKHSNTDPFIGSVTCYSRPDPGQDLLRDRGHDSGPPVAAEAVSGSGLPGEQGRWTRDRGEAEQPHRAAVQPRQCLFLGVLAVHKLITSMYIVPNKIQILT